MDRELIKNLWSIIEPIVEADGLELVEIEFKFESGRWILRTYIDGPTGINLDECEYISRQISAILDLKDPIDKAYTLEVSSPGINRVLRKESDFNRFAGSRVKIRTSTKLDGRRNFVGILKGVENNKVVLDVDGNRFEIDPDHIDKARLDLPQEELFGRDPRRGAANARD
jgi:ribosome maturation factor RimP